jgi:hypothetical protein
VNLVHQESRPRRRDHLLTQLQFAEVAANATQITEPR